ncbi:CHAT domain-containing protein [Amycolatopsis thailandensis]|uniref:CHAT domain-containing protein n=1 Tax=Amycolatopsis thailandensis TaxID=589330 RepID=UPI00365810A9
MTRELATVVTVDHTDGLRRVHDHRYNRERTIHLCFTREAGEGGYLVQAWGSAFPEDGGGGYRGRLTDVDTVHDYTDILRRRWQDKLIQHSERRDGRTRYPFAENWDLSGPDDHHRLDEVGLSLAKAGQMLFTLLFRHGDEGLTEIADRLECALREAEHVITVESDKLFIPWGMLYTTPREADNLSSPDATWSLDGFWGYRHLVEHGFSRLRGFDSRIHLTADQVVVGLNVDERVDDAHPQTPCIKAVIDFFECRTNTVVRRNKDELAWAIQQPEFADHITYFGCHGEVSGDGTHTGPPYLRLQDDEEIHGAELIGWLTHRPLPTRPLVFISACQGGQLSSKFYRAFGRDLLDHGARCLVGPQIDLPRAFAREYTTRLFEAFLQPETKLGDVIRNLARTFADDYRNPLGLIFSLYRGMDVHLWNAQ